MQKNDQQPIPTWVMVKAASLELPASCGGDSLSPPELAVFINLERSLVNLNELSEFPFQSLVVFVYFLSFPLPFTPFRKKNHIAPVRMSRVCITLVKNP